MGDPCRYCVGTGDGWGGPREPCGWCDGTGEAEPVDGSGGDPACPGCGALIDIDCVCLRAEAHAGTCPAVTIGRRYSRTGRLLGVIAWAEPERCACTWPAVVREEVGRG